MRRKITSLVGGCLCLLIVLGGIVGYRMYSTIQGELHKERSYHMRETIGQMISHMEYVLDKKWGYLCSAEYVLQRYYKTEEAASPDEIVDQLNEMFGFESAQVVLIDNQGNIYFKNHVHSLWNNVCLSDSEKQQLLYVGKNLSQGRIEQMFFARKLEEVIPLDGENAGLTHVALLQDMEYFERMFKASVYQNENHTILLNADGNRLYNDSSADNMSDEEREILEVYNVKQALNDDIFIYRNSYEQLKEDIEAGNTGTVAVKLNESRFYIGYGEVADNWRLMMLVPEQYISANTAGVTSVLIHSFIIFGSALLLIVVLVVFWITYSYGREKQYEKERMLNRKLQEAMVETNRANRAKTDFLSHMSHDIRTPINGIMGMLTIAEQHMGDRERVRDCMHKIRGSSNHLMSLINDILDVSKAESGKIELSHEAFELSGLLESCISMISGQIAGHGLKFETDFAGLKHLNVYGSPLHVRQILVNILSNAVKYTKDGGKILFCARELPGKEGYYRFTIKDSGIGMSEEFQKTIFEPFTQEHNTSRTEYRGTGLGMSICHALTEQMGGTIEVKSTRGIGSTFTVTLPLEINTSVQERAVEEDKEEHSIAGMNILLVEDNSINLEIANVLLEEQGATVSVAMDGQQGVDVFEASRPGEYDAILMDVMMPVLNGYEATRTIRSMDRLDAKTVPIIAMTANAFAEDIRQAKDTGMNEHIAKPLEVERLYRILASYKQGA